MTLPTWSILGLPYKTFYKKVPITNGLAFASAFEELIPPTLKIILTELASDVYPTTFSPELFETPRNELWGFKQADEGVLLLNKSLTRTPEEMHTNIWKEFIDYIIDYLNNKDKLAWLVFTNNFPYDVNSEHFYFQSSMNEDLLGERPFSRVNAYLTQNTIEPIKW